MRVPCQPRHSIIFSVSYDYSGQSIDFGGSAAGWESRPRYNEKPEVIPAFVVYGDVMYFVYVLYSLQQRIIE